MTDDSHIRGEPRVKNIEVASQCRTPEATLTLCVNYTPKKKKKTKIKRYEPSRQEKTQKNLKCTSQSGRRLSMKIAHYRISTAWHSGKNKTRDIKFQWLPGVCREVMRDRENNKWRAI